MGEPVRLRAVPDFDTGEVPDDAPSYSEALRLLKIKEGKIRGAELQIDNLKAELADKRAREENAPEVRSVLDWWCARVLEERWWSRLPTYDANDGRWKPTQAQLNKGRTPEYLRIVVDEALRQASFQRKSPRFKRRWLEPRTIFGADMDSYYEDAFDPSHRWVRAAREVPIALRDRWAEIESDGDMCDCGHIRYDHDKPKPLEGVYDPPCLVPGCTDCPNGFDDFHVRAEQHLRERDVLARRRMG